MVHAWPTQTVRKILHTNLLYISKSVATVWKNSESVTCTHLGDLKWSD